MTRQAARIFILLAALIQVPAAAPAQPASQTSAGAGTGSEPVQKNNYAEDRNWLCKPGRAGDAAAPGAGNDACAADLSTTIVNGDGTLSRETWSADVKAPIDCFYVYPTVSTDPGTNSDMTADPAELNVVRQQFARFASKCRPFAPLYRQVTLAGLRRVLAGGSAAAALDRGIGYDDVVDAWRHYLATENRGRGFVLIGHSQGSFVLAEMIRREIDGKPVQKQLVSAILMGATMAVPKGQDVGGSFKNIPLCKSPGQIGCVITFVSFRSTVPPPANTLFGRVDQPGQVAACTNPAALAGGTGQLHAYLTRDGRTITGTSPLKPWVVPEQAIDTPWVSVPGLLTARCASNEHASGYLEVTVNGNPADPRADDIVGDLGAGPAVLANWGLHLIDVNLAIGNLIDIVAQQAKSYAARR